MYELVDNDRRDSKICRVEDCNQISKADSSKRGKKSRRGAKPFCATHVGLRNVVSKKELSKIKSGSLVKILEA